MIRRLSISRERLPLCALLAMTASWWYFYKARHPLNEYGAYTPEWVMLIDGLVVLPLICAWALWGERRHAGLKTLAYVSVVVLLGSFLIPVGDKHVWLYLEHLRYVPVGVFLLLEVSAVATVVIAIRAAIYATDDPDIAIDSSVNSWLGNGAVAELVKFEARTWTYVLLASKVNARAFAGDEHFSVHKKDDTQATLLGFLILIGAEIPVVHVLMHFLWSPFAAWIATILSVLGWLYFFAERRAISRRPVSRDTQSLTVRYGLRPALCVPFNLIDRISASDVEVRRARDIRRYNLFGKPNVCLELTMRGASTLGFSRIYLGVDEPDSLIRALQERLST